MEGSMKFIYQFDENAPKVELTLSPEATLTEVLEQFEGFLFAAGYRYEGTLDFVNEHVKEETENVTA